MSTKLESLKQHIASGAGASQRYRVLWLLNAAEHFGLDPLSREEVESLLGMRTSSACARLNELEKAGAIKVSGTKTSATTGKAVQIYRPALAQQKEV